MDLFHKYNLMVIITFWMDSVLYPDLTNDKTIQLCLDNFRHTLRQNKGHPAVLMWAIGLEPNDPENPASFSEDLDMFFDFQEHIKNVRDDEEFASGYYPHPIMIPLADYEFETIVVDYDVSYHDVWGIQPYRGETFGNLFSSYVSDKPLIVSEYGMDAYNDVILNPAHESGLVTDANWEALDVRDDLHSSQIQMYKPENVAIVDGQAVFTFEVNTSYDYDHAAYTYRSGRLSSWNKVCFTGGYIEARVRLPGTAYVSGLEAAFSIFGNLGRTGYYDSMDGLWPWSYNYCDTVAQYGQADWANSDIIHQNFSACNDYSAEYGWPANVGRGSPQADVFVSQVPSGGWDGTRGAYLRQGLNLAPKIPPNTTHGAGLTGDCTYTGDTCTGINFLTDYGYYTGMDTNCMYENGTYLGGDTLHDCVAADSNVYETHFDDFHRYGMWIDPSGQYMAWYIDDTVVFELSSTGLTNKTNPNNVTQTVGERLIPKEPMYIALGMQSDAIGSVALPDYMEVDWVRLWQRSGTDSMGCDPTDYPTSTFISSRTSTFGTLVCGDGICQAGECSQCPADCLEQEGCKQNCNVTQCQVRDTDFVDPSTYWTYTVGDSNVRATIDWRTGSQGVYLDIFHSGWLTDHMMITQDHLTLCQDYRYRLNVTARALSGNGTVVMTVTDSSGSTIVLDYTARLTSTTTSIYQDFRVDSRLENAQVKLQLGLWNHNTTLEFFSVELCPVPSKEQMCYGARGNTP